MAGRDYILCSKCGVKLLYDGNQHHRESLEVRWGNPDFNIWTVKLLCPDCIKELQTEVEQLQYLVEEQVNE
jgi:hypothetical protein